ncbi:Protein odd-skipped [Portunus trituberculatus]|uniref:Protein odd-skipped n=2 Tax=Portunus trituberculatus TaxID=210409 RepID=A0A5B7J4Y5_PORTR|nr:Protein odd-skipped [Portunus trituberculatus]
MAARMLHLQETCECQCVKAGMVRLTVAAAAGGTVAGLAVEALAVVEGGRVCRRPRREGGRSYVCRVCERRFPRPYLLLVHERTHTPLTCPVCGRTFRRSEHLRIHR